MTGLCVSGNPVSAGDMSIKVTEHCPHLLCRKRKNRTPSESPPHKTGLVIRSTPLSWCTLDFELINFKELYEEVVLYFPSPHH